MKKSRKYATLDGDKISKISLALATSNDVET
ncbi:Uncharacterised protein [Chlamydia abortus]|jgi:hypothetical protein|nr:Uncharacterised protein [Chlamydia abortus]SGA32068.1 Uncharacterised protein [Chlamydia abortus]